MIDSKKEYYKNVINFLLTKSIETIKISIPNSKWETNIKGNYLIIGEGETPEESERDFNNKFWDAFKRLSKEEIVEYLLKERIQ